MRPSIAVIVLMLFAPIVAAAVHPSWASKLGVDFWNLPALRENVRMATEREEMLGTEDAEILRRISAKEELIHSLVAGRITMSETAAQFKVLNEGYEDYLTVIRQIYPGSTDEEKTLWNVVDHAHHRLIDLPAWQRLATLARFQSEMHILSTEFAAVDAN